MKLIQELDRKIDKDGNKRKWGKFLCPYCLKEVERKLSSGKIAKSCGCAKNKFKLGKKPSEETRQKMSKSQKGKKRTEEFKNSRLGRKNPFYGSKLFVGENNPFYGKKHTEETRKLMRENRPNCSGENNPMYGIQRFGDENPNWQGGKSYFESYGIEFNKELKNFILERDNYTCQCPDCEHLSERLDVHHIDYDKKNNSLDNLITLCNSCHSKTNGKNKRKYFTEFYQNIMIGKLMGCLL